MKFATVNRVALQLQLLKQKFNDAVIKFKAVLWINEFKLGQRNSTTLYFLHYFGK